MSLRAIVLGILGAILICSVTYFNDALMGQTMLIGNSLPLAVFGGLILFLLLINPLLRRLRPGLELRGRELAVAMAMILAACAIPGSGLMRSFTTTLMLPHHFERTEPGWSEQRIVQRAPDIMLADPEQNEVESLNGFIQGLRTGVDQLSLGDIPWYAWARTLSFWLPLIFIFWIGLTALAVVVHRQWSQHEQLPYPVAIFANALLPAEGEAQGSIFRNKLFWTSTGIVTLLYLNNYLQAWHPESLIKIPTQFDFRGLLSLFPALKASGGGYVFLPTFYFTAVAFAFFLASSVSLSVGIGPILWAIVVAVLTGYGISMSGGGTLTPKPTTFLNFGAYLGVFLSLLYTGRHYYSLVAKQALALRSCEAGQGHIIWGARVFVVSMAASVLFLVRVGLDWQLSVLYVGMMTMLFLVMGRIIAETGIFFLNPAVFPCTILYGLMGAQALGPDMLVILFLLTAVFLIDPREALMTFLVNGFKLAEMRQAPIGRTAIACVAAVAVGLCVAVPVTLYFQYDRGANMRDTWAAGSVPKMPFAETTQVTQRLEAQERLASAEAISGFERFTAMAPDGTMVVFFVIGLGLVLVTAAGRLRFTWFPIHPVLFLIWSTYPGRMFAHSFLAGWFIKVMVSKYAGAAGYQHLKPFMLGLIAGEILGGVVPVIVGFIYYSITGVAPVTFRVLPS